MKLTNTFVKILIPITLLATLFIGCGKNSKIPANTLVFAQESEPKTLDVHKENKGPALRINKQIYSRLVESDGEMNITPGLAESWKYLDDNTLQLKLRKNVKFHNGDLLTAEDVKFSIERIKVTPGIVSILPPLAEIKIEDDYTIDIVTKKPFGAMLVHLAHPAMAIVSKKLLEKDPEALTKTPIGTGPYKFKEWLQGQKIVLERNNDYFQEPAKFKTLEIRTIPEDSSRAIALEAGEVDIARGISAVDLPNLRANKNLVIQTKPSMSYSYMGINNQNKKFTDVRVRRALNYAINKQAIVDSVLSGEGIVATSPLAPKVFGHTDNVTKYEYDVEKAKELLKEAGFEKGFDTKLTILPSEQQVATIIQANLKEIGINVTIDTMEVGAFFDYTGKGEHELFLSSWGCVTGDANYGLYNMYHSSAIGDPGNRDFYKSSEVDAKLDLAVATINKEEREMLYEAIQQRIVDDSADVGLYYRNLIVGMQSNIKGFDIHPTTLSDLYPVYKDK